MTTITSTEQTGIGRFVELSPDASQDDIVAQTVVAYLKQTQRGESDLGYVFCKELPGNWIRHVSYLDNQWIWGTSSTGQTGSPSSGSTGVVVNGVWFNIAFTHSGSMTDAGSLYKDAALLPPGSPYNGSGSLSSDAGKPTFLFNRTTKNRAFIGDVAYVARWNRVLSIAELEIVRDDGPLSVPDGLLLCFANGQDYGPYNLQVVDRSAYVAGELPPNLNLGGDTPVIVDHATTGDVVGNTAEVTGSADLTEPATIHQASGVLTGQLGAIAGTANRFRAHDSSGSVANTTHAAVTGAAELINPVYIHETEGVLTGAASVVTGEARRFRAHATEGTLVPTDSQGDPTAKVVGSAVVASPAGVHECYGALTGQRGTVAGTARHQRKHVTTGALAGKTAYVIGEALHEPKHQTAGAVAGKNAAVSGTARRFRAHSATGAVVGNPSSVAGSASRNTGPSEHSASGNLTGQLGKVTGTARRKALHSTSGGAVGRSSVVTGSAYRRTPVEHFTSGVVTSFGPQVVGKAKVHPLEEDTIPKRVFRQIAALVAPELLIYADQNSPRPPIPYWTINQTLPRKVGSDTLDQGVDDAGDILINGVREGTFTVQRIGNDSDQYVSELQNNLSRITVREKWWQDDLALYNMGNVLNVPYLMDKDHFEPRASIDLFIRYGTALLDNVGIIETVVADGTYP